jgi:hypothetical protein
VLDAAVQLLTSVEVAVGAIGVQGAVVDAQVYGEVLPRRFEDVTAVSLVRHGILPGPAASCNAPADPWLPPCPPRHPTSRTATPLQSVRLGSGYDTLRVDLSASPHERHPSSNKCTMLSPHAHRHLRHVTGIAALRAQDQQHEVQSTKRAADSSVPALESAFRGRPAGGRVHVRVEASGVVSGVVPPPPGPQALPAKGGSGSCAQDTAPQDTAPSSNVPRLDIVVEGRGLHAPIIERLIELPMDISAGRVGHAALVYSAPTLLAQCC